MTNTHARARKHSFFHKNCCSPALPRTRGHLRDVHTRARRSNCRSERRTIDAVSARGKRRVQLAVLKSEGDARAVSTSRVSRTALTKAAFFPLWKRKLGPPGIVFVIKPRVDVWVCVLHARAFSRRAVVFLVTIRSHPCCCDTCVVVETAATESRNGFCRGFNKKVFSCTSKLLLLLLLLLEARG